MRRVQVILYLGITLLDFIYESFTIIIFLQLFSVISPIVGSGHRKLKEIGLNSDK